MPNRSQAVAPPRPIELTLVAKFESPWSSLGEELTALSERRWHPSIEDFRAVAGIPNSKKRKMTSVVDVGSFSEFLGVITQSDDIHDRPAKSIGRLNVITHANPGLLGLSGTLNTAGGCYIGEFSFASPMTSQGIDSSAMSWLNADPQGRVFRDKGRAVFAPNAEIWLIACNGAIGTGAGLVLDMAATFGVRVAAYEDVISYWPEVRGGSLDRARTSIGFIKDAVGEYKPRPGHPIGHGYYCWAKVPPDLAGEHLRDAKIQGANPVP